MEEKLMFPSSGHYAEISNVKCESSERDVSDDMKTCEVNPMRCDNISSGPDLIMKVEPEEDVTRWAPPLPRDHILPGGSLGVSVYAPPSVRCSSDRRHKQPMRVVGGATARFLERERMRNVKFSDRENNVLVKKISENYEKILGRLITGTTAAQKKEIWRGIVAAVNSVSHHARTVAQCKKRYSDIKKKVKEKLNKQRGGKQAHVFFWPYEKHMLSLMSSKMVLNLNGDSPTMSEEDESAHILSPCQAPPIRRSLNDGGQRLDNAQVKEDMAEETSLAATDRSDLLSDQDSQENGNISEAPCESQHSSSVLSQNDTDPHQANGTLERSLRHLSACVKAQTATLRQTNAILRNLSTNMQNGFQQLVQILQQVAHQSSAPPTSMATGGHVGRGRGRQPRKPSTLTKKNRGKS